MACWLQKSFLRNTGIGVRYIILLFPISLFPLVEGFTIALPDWSRIYFVTTVREKGDLDSIGCITNAASAVRIIPESSRLTQQIVRHQINWRDFLLLLSWILSEIHCCKYISTFVCVAVILKSISHYVAGSFLASHAVMLSVHYSVFIHYRATVTKAGNCGHLLQITKVPVAMLATRQSSIVSSY